MRDEEEEEKPKRTIKEEEEEEEEEKPKRTIKEEDEEEEEKPKRTVKEEEEEEKPKRTIKEEEEEETLSYHAVRSINKGIPVEINPTSIMTDEDNRKALAQADSLENRAEEIVARTGYKSLDLPKAYIWKPEVYIPKVEEEKPIKKEEEVTPMEKKEEGEEKPMKKEEEDNSDDDKEYVKKEKPSMSHDEILKVLPNVPDRIVYSEEDKKKVEEMKKHILQYKSIPQSTQPDDFNDFPSDDEIGQSKPTQRINIPTRREYDNHDYSLQLISSENHHIVLSLVNPANTISSLICYSYSTTNTLISSTELNAKDTLFFIIPPSTSYIQCQGKTATRSISSLYLILLIRYSI